jgi:hypothetical protein
MIEATTTIRRQARALSPRAIGALLLAVASLVAPDAFADRDPLSQAACMAKQERLHGGGESGRGSALRAHFECFPDDQRSFERIFEGAGPLAGESNAHFEMFFAARPSVNERAWAAKAVGVLAGGEWRPGIVARYALLLRINIKSRPSAPLDAIARYDDATIELFWRNLFGSDEGFQPDLSLCKGRDDSHACDVLAAIAQR